MPTLIFATHNPHKLTEVRSLLGPEWAVTGLDEAGLHEEIPEPHDTLEANAMEKARTIHKKTGAHCFADDTGLEVSALNGAPGVLSARYAGPAQVAADNIRLLLANLHGQPRREARFRTVIALILDGREYLFEGSCAGHITEKPQGDAGFGYDPVFVPEGGDRTFAQMTLEEKNRVSHRARAFEKLRAFLRQRAAAGQPSQSSPHAQD